MPGLTATPVQRDGLHPIIFMHCGSIRHTAARPKENPHNLEVISRPRFTHGNLPSDARIQDVFREIALNQDRTSAIADETRSTFGQGRKVLVLTERPATDAPRILLDTESAEINSAQR